MNLIYYGKPLTPREEQIRKLLSRNKTQEEICALLGLVPATLRVHISNMTRKGENPFKEAPLPDNLASRLTTAQLKVLRLLYVDGMGFNQTAYELAVSVQTVRNHASHGCNRLGIFTRRAGARKRLVCDALEDFENPMSDPMF